MKLKTIIILVLLTVSIVFLLGCTDQDIDDNTNDDNNEAKDNENNDDTSDANIIIMSVEDYLDDTVLDTDWISYINIYYTTLEDGDTVKIIGNITSISYDSTSDRTSIKFELNDGQVTKSFSPIFEGDISDIYNSGDCVQITVNIKHVSFSNGGMDYDLEIYEEGWVDEETFISSMYDDSFGLAMPKDAITLCQV
jgi:hypothetical protein